MPLNLTGMQKTADTQWHLDTPGRMTGRASNPRVLSCEYEGNVGSLAFSPGRMGMLAIGGSLGSSMQGTRIGLRWNA